MTMGTVENPDAVLRWQEGSDLRSIYLRDDRIVGAQLAGDIRAAGVYRSLMLRRVPVGHFGRRLVEPGFGVVDIVSDALPYGVPESILA
jgi:NAD(P)H-nitrite reductase large subunit